MAADVVLGGAHEGGPLQQRGAGVRLAQDGVHCNNNNNDKAVVSVSAKTRGNLPSQLDEKIEYCA